MGRMQKRKGASGELEFANWLKDNLGVFARRGRQFAGSPDSPDVVTNLPIHFEVKRCESLSLYKAMAQAVEDCNLHEKIPMVAHRRNRMDWLLVLRASDLKKLATATWLRDKIGVEGCLEERTL